MCVIVYTLRSASWSDLLVSCTEVEEEVFPSTPWHSTAASKVCRCWATWNRCNLVVLEFECSVPYCRWGISS